MFFNLSHFVSLMRKNCILLKRNWQGLAMEVIISILCIVAVIIFRKVEDKVLVQEKSYLSEQKTIYPSLIITNAADYYQTLKNMSSKYNFTFPVDNESAFQDDFFKSGSSFIDSSKIKDSAFPVDSSQLSSVYGGAVDTSSVAGASSLSNADPSTLTLRTLIDSNTLVTYSNETNSSSLDVNNLSEEDKMKLYDISENISRSNSMKNCQNPYLGGSVGLSPKNNITQKLETVFSTLYYKTIYFDNDAQINEYVKSGDYNARNIPNLCFAISFTSASVEAGYSYNLRFHQANPVHEIFETNQPWRTHPFKKQWIDKYEKHLQYGFLTMQTWIDNLIIQEVLNDTNANITLDISSVKTPTYYQDDLPTQLQGRFSIFTIIAYILPFLKLIYFIGYEKEKKIKEGMKMMGMNETAFYASWLITYFIIFLVLTLINSLLLKIYIFTFSHYFLIFIIQGLYTFSLMFHALLLTTFFSRTKTAVVAGVFLIFIEYLLIQLVDKESVAYSSKAGASLSPIIAMSLASDLFLELEATETGINFDTVSVMFNNYNVETAIVFFLISSVMFFVLFLYFEQVFPNEFGTKKSPFFFIQCLFRRKKRKNELYDIEIVPRSPGECDKILMTENNDEEKSFEKVTHNLLMQKKEKKTVEIKGLTKRFSSGKLAVNNLKFTMYDNQIFVLLGVNGAGKTTTFSMLTGLIPQTSGTVSYFEYEMDSDMDKIRKIMGVCPQFDILFDDLTVKEHLELYANIKGMKKPAIKDAVNKMIIDLKLEEKTNYQSKTLSGGQKRKLSTGIAFIGGSKLIFLDEPTTGMDPTSRRVLWDVLKMYKEDKIIILTTHFMDEAEYLGDRIGIMGEGILKCCGSPVFLKNLYGIGYNLTIIKTDAEENPEIYKTISSIVKGCKILSEASANMVFQLPMEEVSKFKDLCNTLDANRKKLNISNYGISITSLEEVFLKVAQNRKVHEKDELAPEQNHQRDDFILSDIRIKSNCALFIGQFIALYLKRIHYLKRDLKSLFLEIILPVIIIVIGLALLYASGIDDPYGLYLTPKIYDEEYLVRYSGQNHEDYFNYYGNPNEFFETNQNSTLWDEIIYDERSVTQKGSYYIVDFNENTRNFTYYVIVNTTSPDTAPLFINQMNQMIMRNLFNNPNFNLSVQNYPLAFSETDKENEFLEYQFFTSILFTLSFAFIPSSLVVFFVKERQYKMKHEQMVSGMKSWIYWLSNFLFDLPKCLIPVICTLFIVQGFKVRGLSAEDCWEGLWVLFIIYIINIIPFTYLSSFFFNEYGYAQTISFTLHLMISTVLTLVVGLIRIMGGSTKAATVLAYIFRLIPSFSFGYGTFNIANRKVYAYLEGYWYPKSPYDYDVAGIEMLYLGVTTIVVWMLLLIFELSDEGEAIKAYIADRKVKKISYFRAATMGKKKDQDIIDEKERLSKMDPNELLLKVVDMKKYFYVPYDQKKIKLAVDSLCLGTSKGECFCLLGVNGAGKTTSFRMLTGEIKPDEGQIYINGIDAVKKTNLIRDKIGYCPQIDPLLDILSVEEHLYLFAGLKGIPKKMKKKMIDEKMKDLDLYRFRNISSSSLSGGNKRKLSFAIATLGNPSLIFLDEPSSGMDPESRRFMWNAISKFSGKNSKNSVILTTHLMEEAEALGTRVGIMVNGSFHCLGSTQYLKDRFGKGYELEIVTEIPTIKDLELIAEQYEMEMTTALEMEQITRLLNGMNMTELLNNFKDPEKVAHLFSNSKITFELFAEYCIIEQIGKKVVDFLQMNLGKCETIEHLYSFFRLKIETIKPISALFGVLEDNKEILHIKYYSIRQTTLEQIFNMFATGQIADEDIESNYPRRKKTRIMTKSPILGRGLTKAITLQIADEMKSTINVIGGPKSTGKNLHILTKLGSIGNLAFEELIKRTNPLKSSKSKVFHFFNSFIAGDGKKAFGANNFIKEEPSVGTEHEINEVKINQIKNNY